MNAGRATLSAYLVAEHRLVISKSRIYLATAAHKLWQSLRSFMPAALHRMHTHTHTCLTALCPGLPWWTGIRKVKPIWILLKQETVSGSGIRWAICKSAPRSRQITMPAPATQFFTGRMPFLPSNQQRQSTECSEMQKIIKASKMMRVDVQSLCSCGKGLLAEVGVRHAEKTGMDGATLLCWGRLCQVWVTASGNAQLPVMEYHMQWTVGVDLNTPWIQCKKGSSCSIPERRVSELIPVLGSEPAGDVSHKPGGMLPLLSTRPAVTPATLKRA